MDPKPITISIYVLIDPRDGEIRYVGKTKSPKKRLAGHLKEKDGSHRDHWISKLQRMGLVPRMQVMQEVPETFGSEAEIYWIAYFRATGCRLTNSTDGGEGNSGWTMSDEQKAQVSRVHKGKTISPEHRAIVSKATTERWEQWRTNGRYLSPEARANISAAQRGKRMSDESRRKQSQQRKGVPKSPEHRAALAAHLKAVWSNYTPEQRLALNAKAIAKREANRAAKKESLSCPSST